MRPEGKHFPFSLRLAPLCCASGPARVQSRSGKLRTLTAGKQSGLLIKPLCEFSLTGGKFLFLWVHEFTSDLSPVIRNTFIVEVANPSNVRRMVIRLRPTYRLFLGI
jgi:hypothetical protein